MKSLPLLTVLRVVIGILAMCLFITCSNPISSPTWECKTTLYVCDNIFSCNNVTTFSATGIGDTELDAGAESIRKICDQMSPEFLADHNVTLCGTLFLTEEASQDCNKR